MITFFKALRRRFLVQNRFTKYLIYALGEIILVVIGILIALQINNNNDLRKKEQQELSILKSLSLELNSNYGYLKYEDSFFGILENKAVIALDLFYKSKTAMDIKAVYDTVQIVWNEFPVTFNTYNEMLNSESIYTLKDTNLRGAIVMFYTNAQKEKYYIRGVNETQATLSDQSPDLFPYNFLINQLQDPKIKIQNIDTSWINNPNSNTYLALEKHLRLNLEQNIQYRRSVLQRNMTLINRLTEAIQNYLDIHKK